MTQENDTCDNLIDFTAYKMRSIIEELAAEGHIDLAHGVQLALDQYLLGNINIAFKEGTPYVSEVNTGDT